MLKRFPESKQFTGPRILTIFSNYLQPKRKLSFSTTMNTVGLPMKWKLVINGSTKRFNWTIRSIKLTALLHIFTTFAFVKTHLKLSKLSKRSM